MSKEQEQKTDPNKTSKTIEIDLADEAIIYLTNGETFVTNKYKLAVTGIFCVGTFEALNEKNTVLASAYKKKYSSTVYFPYTSIRYMDIDAAEKVRESVSETGAHTPQNGGGSTAIDQSVG